MTDPMNYVEQKRVELDYAQNRLAAAFERDINRRKQNFVRLATSLDAMSPLKVFSRGFSLASDSEGNIIRSVKQVEKGSEVDIRFSDGTVKAGITEIIGKDDQIWK